MGDNPLQFIAGESLHESPRGDDDGVSRGETRYEGIDTFFRVEDEHHRDGTAGGDGHFLHDIQERLLCDIK